MKKHLSLTLTILLILTMSIPFLGAKDVYAEAEIINIPLDYQYTYDFSSASDKKTSKLFKIELPEAGLLTVNAQSNITDGGLNIYVLDSKYKQNATEKYMYDICSTNGKDGSATISFYLHKGTYYISATYDKYGMFEPKVLNGAYLKIRADFKGIGEDIEASTEDNPEDLPLNRMLTRVTTYLQPLNYYRIKINRKGVYKLNLTNDFRYTLSNEDYSEIYAEDKKSYYDTNSATFNLDRGTYILKIKTAYATYGKYKLGLYVDKLDNDEQEISKPDNNPSTTNKPDNYFPSTNKPDNNSSTINKPNDNSSSTSTPDNSWSNEDQEQSNSITDLSLNGNLKKINLPNPGNIYNYKRLFKIEVPETGLISLKMQSNLKYPNSISARLLDSDLNDNLMDDYLIKDLYENQYSIFGSKTVQFYMNKGVYYISMQYSGANNTGQTGAYVQLGAEFKSLGISNGQVATKDNPETIYLNKGVERALTYDKNTNYYKVKIDKKGAYQLSLPNGLIYNITNEDYTKFYVNDSYSSDLGTKTINLDEGTYIIKVKPDKSDVTLKYKISIYLVRSAKQTYKVEFNTMGGSYIAPLYVESDSLINKPTNPIKSGYTFKGWSTDMYSNQAWNFNNKVNKNMTLYAMWSKNQTSSQNNNMSNSQNNNVSNPTNWYEPKDINSYTPDYSSSGKGITIQYDDLRLDKWYGTAVVYVSERKIMNGTGKNRFSPYEKVNRAMIATILYNMAGNPEISTDNLPFIDVNSSSYYSSAVKWAYASFITSGTSTYRYSPNSELTRQDAVSLLYKYSKVMGKNTQITGDISEFYDSYSVSSYAVEPMKWAIGKGIISGTSQKELQPKNKITRAEMAVMLMNFNSL